MMTPTDDVADLPTLVRWRRALLALARVMKNPEETDQVLVFTNLANARHRSERLDVFFDDPRGQRLFTERRALDSFRRKARRLKDQAKELRSAVARDKDHDERIAELER